MSPTPQQRAVIIGSGLAGLSSAILLAEHGWAVTVLERHTTPGGLMQRYRRGDRWYDTGFHLMTGGAPGGILRAMLHRLGVLDRLRFLEPEAQAQFVITRANDAPLAIPLGLPASATAAAARFPAQAAAIHRFFHLLQGRLAANPWLHMLVPGVSPVDHAPCTVSAALAHCGVTDEAAHLLGMASVILAMRPEACPFDFYAAFAGSAFAGGCRIAEGGDGIIRPLVERLAHFGGTLVTGCGAERLIHDGVRVTAVVDVQGAAHPADLVLATCHPDETVRLAGEHGFRPSFHARLAEVPESRGAVLFGAELTESARALGRSHHCFSMDDGSECYAVAPDQWEPGSLPMLEAVVWVETEELAAWRDSRLGHRPEAYQTWKEAQRRRVLAALAKRFPGLDATVRRTWMSSPLTFRDYTSSRSGGAMGLSHNLEHLGSQPLMPRNRLRNLLLGGQSVSHPGILGTMVGAFVMTGAVLGRDLRAEVESLLGRDQA